MNALVLRRDAATGQMMSSDEIAQLTGKRHDNVIRDTRSMLDDLKKDGPVLDHLRDDQQALHQEAASDLRQQYREEKDSRGRTTMYHLDRELTDVLLTGYSVVARRAVVRRWHQLEREEQQRQVEARSKHEARLEGKVARKALQDVIATFIDYARTQGSSNADWYFTSITKMEYQALGLVKQAGDKRFRDSLDGLTHTKLSMVEMVCQHGLADGMTQGMPYKDIFKLAQSRVGSLVDALEGSLPGPNAPARIELAAHPPPQKKRKASSANCQPLPETRSAPTEQAS